MVTGFGSLRSFAWWLCIVCLVVGSVVVAHQDESGLTTTTTSSRDEELHLTSQDKQNDSPPPPTVIEPKMVAQPVLDPNTPLRERRARASVEVAAAEEEGTVVTSSLVLGSCDVDSPFSFKLSSGEGHGVVCVFLNDENHGDDKSHILESLHLETEIESNGHEEAPTVVTDTLTGGVPNCLGLKPADNDEDDDQTIGLPFEFQNVPNHGHVISLTCDQALEFAVVFVDQLGAQQTTADSSAAVLHVAVDSVTSINTDLADKGVTHLTRFRHRLSDPSRYSIQHVWSVETYHPHSAQEDVLSDTENRSFLRTAGGANEKESAIKKSPLYEKAVIELSEHHTQGLDGDAAGDNNNDHDFVLANLDPETVVLVRYEIRDEKKGGATFQRTLVATVPEIVEDSETGDATVSVESSHVNNQGDVEIVLSGLPQQQSNNKPGKHLLCTVRVGIVWLDADGEREQQQDSVVDVSAMIYHGQSIVVHGGWIRTHIEQMQSHTSSSLDGEDGFDIVVEDAHCEDPNRGYHISRTLHPDSQNRRLAAPKGVSEQEHAQRKRLLSQTPADEERQVSKDMLMGRRPPQRRSLQQGCLDPEHRIVLVHGFCSGRNPFDVALFQGDGYSVEDMLDENTNYSNDAFARSLAEQHCPHDGGNIAGAVVGHSQGGMAALHLYNYYWSCFDNNEYQGPADDDPRLIQSVGSPYRGTNLAGGIAGLGALLGFSCGSNGDLTHGGATSWLNGIQSWARETVWYYRTQFGSSPSNCVAAANWVLGEPNDGTIEVARGNLPSGGHDMGVTVGQCHTRDMNYEAQCDDATRNGEMRAAAAMPPAGSTPAPASGSNPGCVPQPLTARQPTAAPVPPAPTASPTGAPTKQPTGSPTSQPTRSPTASPTGRPTVMPSDTPTTAAPTDEPTTGAPTDQPITGVPTNKPINESPADSPTSTPTTSAPTDAPITGSPTASPTTAVPTSAPTLRPTTSMPTGRPTTSAPTQGPTTAAPTRQPTTRSPTDTPTSQPVSPPPTDAPVTPPPTDAPVAPAPSPGICFAIDSSTVHVKGKGEVGIMDVRLNDLVLSDVDGTFSKVYAFGHRSRHHRNEMIQIQTSCGNVALELTPDHMVYLAPGDDDDDEDEESSTLPITASRVRAGDILKLAHGHNVLAEQQLPRKNECGTVRKVSRVMKEGFITPITTSGTIVVNGIVASTYAGKHGSENYFHQKESSGETPFAKMLHYQRISHVAVAPLRFACAWISSSFCREGLHNKDDGNDENSVVVGREGQHVFFTWVHQLKHFVRSDACGPVLHAVLFAAVMGIGLTVSILEWILSSSDVVAVVVATTIVLVLAFVSGFVFWRKQRLASQGGWGGSRSSSSGENKIKTL